MDVSNELLEEFKERMHISHSIEDSNLKRLLSFSVAHIRNHCGKFDIDGKSDADLQARELVLERTRYAYNEATEYFDKNFMRNILTLGIHLADWGDEDATE